MKLQVGDRVRHRNDWGINTPPGLVTRVDAYSSVLFICVSWTTRRDIWYSEGDLIKVDNGLDIMLGII